MSVRFSEGLCIEPLDQHHGRKRFDCGSNPVNDWLRTKARQSQQKHLRSTRVLVNAQAVIAGFYTLAYGHVRMDQLPTDVAKKLPDTLIPVAVLAWLGVDEHFRGQGLGDRLLAHALLQAREAAQIIPFVGVVIDCLDAAAKAFYQRYEFAEFPGHPMKLLVSRKQLDALAGT